MSRKRVAVLCVADSLTKYLYQSLRFVLSARNINTDHQFVCFVGYFDGAPQYFDHALRDLGAEPIRLVRYSKSHGPSNKLAILRAPRISEFDTVILADCDVVFIDGFDDVLARGGFQAKIADVMTLPESTLRKVFSLAGRAMPDTRFVTTLDRAPTILYCNAGLVVFDKAILSSFVDRWFYWNDMLLRQQSVMGRLSFFTDQASFCLAAEEFPEEFYPLDIDMNYPTHFPVEAYPESELNRSARVIHYHDAIDPRSPMLDMTRIRGQHSGISKINKLLSECQTLTSGPLFWDFFYSNRLTGDGEDPFYNFRVGLISQVIKRIGAESIIDLGCGALPLSTGVDVESFVGIDFSQEAIAAAGKMDPLGKYYLTHIRDSSLQAEMVLLVDVLPYIPASDEFQEIVEKAAAAALDVLVLSGLEEPIDAWNRPQTFFHLPVEQVISALSGFDFHKIGQAAHQGFYLGHRRKVRRVRSKT